MYFYVTLWLDEDAEATLTAFASEDFGPFDTREDVFDTVEAALGARWRRMTREELLERRAREPRPDDLWHQLELF